MGYTATTSHKLRRRTTVLAAAALATLALTSCTSRLLPFRLSAAPADLAALAGEWAGEYQGRESGRSGSIVLRLEEGTGLAYGDVLMVPARGLAPASPRVLPIAGGPAGDSCPGTPVAQAEVLAISFARVEGGAVTGTLAPYRDPEYGCAVQTTFTGRLVGTTIQGTFVTQGPGLPKPHTGTWTVTRRAKAGA